jgi:tRNA A37 threonylcarbamoyladenosine synthetase subunit TsaC/SUA5/YrdC
MSTHDKGASLSIRHAARSVWGRLSRDSKWGPCEPNVPRSAPKCHLWLDDPEHISSAVRSLAGGAGVIYGFANFYALAFRPEADVVRTINQAKGRPANQTASVTTVREHIPALFDWSQLPQRLDRERVMRMIDTLYGKGPLGFRGPAAAHLPDHLTVWDEARGTRTVQLIAPGYDCPSNAFLTQAIAETNKTIFGITSVNTSSNTTGREEPAHYRISGAKADLGHAGFVMLAHGHGTERCEERARRRYPGYGPMSVTVLGFHGRQPVGDTPYITAERHGSLPIAEVTELLSTLGLGCAPETLGVKRIACRQYERTQPQSPQRVLER